MKLKVTDEGLQDLRKIYAEYSSITLFDENTNERKYNSIEDLKLAKKEVIQRYINEFYEVAQSGVPIDKLPELIDNW
jgi:hypothetical protein